MTMLDQLALSLPEEILTIGGLVLLMVAAFLGDKTTRLVGYAAVALLLAAGLIAQADIDRFRDPFWH